MKVLRVFERVLLIVAVAMFAFCIAFAFVLDTAYVSGTGEVVYIGLSSFLASFFGEFGVAVPVAFIIVGALLYFVKENIARKVGTGLLIVGFIFTFVAGIAAMEYATSGVLGMVSAILFLLALMFRLIRWIVKVSKPESGDEADPMSDPKVKLILKWKSLLDQKVITEEEYELKRKEIISSIDKKPGK